MELAKKSCYLEEGEVVNFYSIIDSVSDLISRKGV